jgi:hypothetical protein
MCGLLSIEKASEIVENQVLIAELTPPPAGGGWGVKLKT